MKKKNVIWIGVVAILLVVFFFVPCWRVTNRSYNCVWCGAYKSKRTTSVLAVPVWIRRSGIQRHPVTDLYDKYIGQPHEHEWAGGGYSYTLGTLRGRGLHADGFHTVQPFPTWQPALTRTALMAVAQVADWPKEERIKLFHAILDCTSRESYEDVAEVYKRAEQGPPEELWMDWLEKKKELERATVPDD